MYKLPNLASLLLISFYTKSLLLLLI